MFLISKKIYSGIYAAIYMMSYSLFRFVIEYFRGDLVRGVWYGVSTSQYISICIFVVGVVTLIKSIQIKENNLLITGRRRKKDANEYVCNGVQREHNKKLNNGLPILHKVPPKRDYGRYFCIMAEKGGTSHGGLTEKLSPFFMPKNRR